MVDGIYNIVVATPAGLKEATLELKTDGEVLIPALTMKGKTLPISNGTVNGSDINFSGQIKSPVGKMPYDCVATVDEEAGTLRGHMKTKKGDMPMKGAKA